MLHDHFKGSLLLQLVSVLLTYCYDRSGGHNEAIMYQEVTLVLVIQI